MGFFGTFVKTNRRLSAAFDRQFLPHWYSVDGNRDFLDEFAPAYLETGQRIVDVGGGKNPYLSPRQKEAFACHVTGFDIDASELGRAPPRAYDRVIIGDICSYRGPANADLVICQALLEHVRDMEGAFAGLASLVRPGGRLLIFAPSRNALFARINLLLPQSWKQALLFRIYPDTRGSQGFPSYYDRCTPGELLKLGHRNALALEAARYYFASSYFTFFLPFHVIWRIWLMARGLQAAETFAMAFRKPE